MIKQLLIGILATLLTLGFFGTAFAGNLISPHSSEGGVHEFKFDAPMTKADIAAKNYVYDQERLSKVGTEGGLWKFDFDAPETKADLAAKNYQYDQERLSNVGTEGGNWEYSFDSEGSRGSMCSTC